MTWNSHYGVIDGCAVLMLDEVHSGSSDMELILARVLPKLKNITNFKVVLLSATLNQIRMNSCNDLKMLD